MRESSDIENRTGHPSQKLRMPEPGSPQIWLRIKKSLESSLSESDFQTWIAPLGATETTPSELIVGVPNLVFYQCLQHDYAPKIDAAKEELGLSDLVIRYELTNTPAQPAARVSTPAVPKAANRASATLDERFTAVDAPSEESDELDSVPGESGEPSELNENALRKMMAREENETPIHNTDVYSPQSFSRSLSNEPRLNKNYTFDKFVTGPSNQFAVATCKSVADNPGHAFNPLFIYGSTGLGKTHLLHAVGNQVRQKNPDLVVTYITSELFMNEMIHCVRHGKMWEFRQKYRFCDVLLVDDIQFIKKKTNTQEEFFHTFNTLYGAKKQIVITSDNFPQDIPDIEDRLRNRFQWGLITDIQPPELEHRMAILLKKAETIGAKMSIEVAEYIAKHARKNVRELEGALHRIVAYSTLHGLPINMELALKTFKDVLGEPPKRLTVEHVQRVVADHFKLKVADLKSKRRVRSFAHPRQIAMYLARKMTGASFPDIGERFGGKDHTTVMHNVRKVDEVMQKNLDLKAHVESLERQLEQLN